MAAGLYLVSVLSISIIFSTNQWRFRSQFYLSSMFKNNGFEDIHGLYMDGQEFGLFEPVLNHRIKIHRWELESRFKVSFAIVRFTKHGLICLVLLSKLFEVDLTVCKDISPKPGPDCQFKLRTTKNIESQNKLPPLSNSNSFNRVNLHNMGKINLCCTRLGLGWTAICCPYTCPRLLTEQYAYEHRPDARINHIPVRITGNHYSRVRNYSKSAVNLHNVVMINTTQEKLPNIEPITEGLKFCTLNAQSLNNKAATFIDYVCDRKPDVVAVTETWFTDKESASRALCTPIGYKLLDHPRLGRLGGGTGVLFRNNITTKKVAAAELQSFEYSEWDIKSGFQRIKLIIIYRPPYSDRHPVTTGVFITEFANFFGICCPLC